MFYTPCEMFHNLCTDFIIISEFPHVQYFPNLTLHAQRLCIKITIPVFGEYVSTHLKFCFYYIWWDISLWSKVVGPALQQWERNLIHVFSILHWWISSASAMVPASAASEQNSSLVPLQPGDCVSLVVASSSKPIHFDFKGGRVVPSPP